MITCNEFPVPRDCHNLLCSLKIALRTYDKEKLQELALPRLASLADFFPFFPHKRSLVPDTLWRNKNTNRKKNCDVMSAMVALFLNDNKTNDDGKENGKK